MSKITKAYDVRVYVEFDYDELQEKYEESSERHGRNQLDLSFAQGRRVELSKPEFYPSIIEVLFDALNGYSYKLSNDGIEEPDGKPSILLTQDPKRAEGEE